VRGGADGQRKCLTKTQGETQRLRRRVSSQPVLTCPQALRTHPQSLTASSPVIHPQHFSCLLRPTAAGLDGDPGLLNLTVWSWCKSTRLSALQTIFCSENGAILMPHQ